MVNSREPSIFLRVALVQVLKGKCFVNLTYGQLTGPIHFSMSGTVRVLKRKCFVNLPYGQLAAIIHFSVGVDSLPNVHQTIFYRQN